MVNLTSFQNESTSMMLGNQSVDQDHFHGEKLSRCFVALCNNEPLEDLHRYSRLGMTGIASVVAAAAKIPFIPIALRLGPVMGPVSAVGNCAGFFVLEYWAINSMIEDVLGAKTRAELELFQKEAGSWKKRCKNVLILSASSLIALASQVPPALAGVQYNDPRYKIVAGLVLMLAGLLIPARSIQLSLEQLQLIAKGNFESEINKMRSRMVALIRSHHQIFLNQGLDGKKAVIGAYNQIRQIENPEEKAVRYLLTATDVSGGESVNRTQFITRKFFDYTGLALGAISAGIFEYALGEYTFSLTKDEIYNDDATGVVFATLAVGSTAYLYGRSIVQTTQRIFNVFGNLITGQEVRNLSWQLRPHLSFALTAIGLLIDICAQGPSYVIWGNFYNQNEFQHQFFQKSMCASIFLLLFTSTLDIIDQVVARSIGNGTEEEKEILKVHVELQKLASLVEKSPVREFVGYLSNLEPDAKELLLERLSLTSEKLADYAENV